MAPLVVAAPTLVGWTASGLNASRILCRASPRDILASVIDIGRVPTIHESVSNQLALVVHEVTTCAALCKGAARPTLRM